MPNRFSEGRNYKDRKGIVIQRLWVFEFRDPVLDFREVSELRVPPNLIYAGTVKRQVSIDTGFKQTERAIFPHVIPMGYKLELLLSEYLKKLCQYCQ